MAFRDSWERYVDERRKAGDNVDENQPIALPRSRFRELDQTYRTVATYNRDAVGGGVGFPDVHSALTLNGVAIPGYGGSPGGTKQEMTDIVTPGFKRRKSQGTILNSPMSSFKETWTKNTGTVKLVSPYGNGGTNTVQLNGHWSCFFENPTHGITWHHPDIVDTRTLIRTVSIDTLKKVNKPQSMALVTAYEMNKTLDLIGGTAKKIADLIKLAKSPSASYDKAVAIIGRRFKNSPTTKQKTTDVIQSRWLEWRYGWGPLVYDIEGLLKASFETGFTHVTNRRTARGYGNETLTSISGSAPNSLTLVGNSVFGTATSTLTCQDVVNVRGYALYDFARSLQGPNAFGIFSIPETLWEITPYSFVVDWFIPVGDYISALSPKVGVNILASGYSMTRTKTSTRRISAWTVASPYITQTSPVSLPTDTYESVYKSRIPLLNLGAYPPVEVKLNAKRCLDAIALLNNFKR